MSLQLLMTQAKLSLVQGVPTIRANLALGCLVNVEVEFNKLKHRKLFVNHVNLGKHTQTPQIMVLAGHVKYVQTLIQ